MMALQADERLARAVRRGLVRLAVLVWVIRGGPTGGHAAEPPDFAALLHRALQAAEKIEDPEQQTWALVWIAGVQVEAKDSEAALETLERARKAGEMIRPEKIRISPHALAWVARYQAAAGDIAAAHETYRWTLQQLLEQEAYSQCYMFLINTLNIQSHSGDRKGARENLQLLLEYLEHHPRQPLIPGDAKTTALSTLHSPATIAKLQAKVRDFAGARRTLDDPQSFPGPDGPTFRRQALFELLQLTRVTPEDRREFEPFIQEGLRSVPEFVTKDRHQKSNALLDIAMAWTQLHQFDQALQAADGIGRDNPDLLGDFAGGNFANWAFAYAIIATEQAKQGDREGVWQTAQRLVPVCQAWGKAGPVGFEEDPPHFDTVVVTLIELGDLDRAHQLRDQLQPGLKPSFRVAQEFANAEERAGRKLAAERSWGKALEAARRANDLPAIAEVQARMGDLAAARQTVSTLPASERQQALERVATSLARGGKFAQALRVADELDVPEVQATAFASIASHALAAQRASRVNRP